MITEILNFTTSNRVEQIYLEKYNRNENLMINTHLHSQKVEDYINELKERFSEESDELILLVVKYVLPNKPENIDDDTWKTYQENFTNVWGFKILYPKLF
jgi:hypothetical protein